MEKRSVHVTGASAGIGKAFAHEFARRGWDLVLVARRETLLDEVAESCRRDAGAAARVIALDLSLPDAAERLLARLEAESVTIDALVNNAAVRVPGTLADVSWESHGAVLQLHVVAPTRLCHGLLPGMIERDFGRILNVSSLTAFKQASRGKALYAATKSYLTKLSTTLWTQTEGSNVHVTVVHPGFTTSEYHTRQRTRTRGYRRLPFVWMEAESVARAAYAAVSRGDAACVPGLYNKAYAAWLGMLPRRLALALRQ